MSVKSGTIIPLGEWTKIRAGRFGQKLYLSVNGITNSRVMPADTNVMLKKLLIHFGEYYYLLKCQYFLCHIHIQYKIFASQEVLRISQIYHLKSHQAYRYLITDV